MENKSTLAQWLEETYGYTCSYFISNCSSEEAMKVLEEYDRYLQGA